MRTALLLCALVALSAMVFAQPQPDTLWSRRLDLGGAALAYDIQPTADGGMVIVGQWGEPDDPIDWTSDLLMAKLNAQGQMLWAETWGWEMTSEQAMSLSPVPGGGWLVAGITCASCPHDLSDWGNFLIARVDDSGDTVWTREYNLSDFDWAFSIVALPDGGSVLTGPTSLPGACLMRLNAEGDSLWTRHYAETQRQRQGSAVAVTPDGGFVLAGTEYRTDGLPIDGFVLKTDGNGNLLWERTFGQPANADYAIQVIATADGGYAVSGHAFLGDPQGTHSFIYRLSSTGDSLWQRYYNGTGAIDESYGLAETPDGGYVLAGLTVGPDGQFIDIIRVNALGIQEWNAACETNYERSSQGSAVCVTADGSYAVCGATQDGNNPAEAVVIKFAGSPSAAVEDERPTVPQHLSLLQNYPNPFNSETEIRFELPQSMEIELVVYDLLGQPVAELAKGYFEAGSYRIPFHAEELPSGIYFYRLAGGGAINTRKMTLLR